MTNSRVGIDRWEASLDCEWLVLLVLVISNLVECEAVASVYEFIDPEVEKCWSLFKSLHVI